MANDEIGFNDAELRVLAFLGDEKGHAQWEICDKLELDKGYLSKILKGLKNKGLILNGERPLVRRKGTRGPQIEYPYYIQKDQLRFITTTILHMIRRYLSECKSARSERELLRAKDALTPARAEELSSHALLLWGAAERTMMVFRDSLYRDCLSKIYNMNYITYNGARSLIYSEFGMVWYSDAKTDNISPVDAFQKLLSDVEHEREVEAERRKIEVDPIAMQKIKELWAKGERTNLLRAFDHSPDAVIAQINQMLACKEIS